LSDTHDTDKRIEDALEDLETVIREPHRKRIFHKVEPVHEAPPEPVPYISNEPEKLDYTLMPLDALEDVAHALMYGRDKYGEWQWTNDNYKWTEFLAKAQRHIYAFTRGEDIDPKSGLPHIACAIADLMFLQSHIHQRTGVDNRYKR
jgi:Domain of unknown function (DUF5664)